jgi:stearoyl-CoA desaturase (delta-9 desaturase)
LVEGHERVVFVPANLIQVVVVHAVVLAAAPYFFTWRAFLFDTVSVVTFLYALGIGHHMLLTHRSFRCPLWAERLGSLLATLTWRGPFAGPVRYVATHRIHHAYSDTPLDPHTPVTGVWHAMMSWFWNMPQGLVDPATYSTYAADLDADPWHRFCDRNVHRLQLGWGIFCFALGTWGPHFLVGSSGWLNGVRFVVYGVFVKTLSCFYIGNVVDWINHAPHPGSYRNYDTGDRSSNSWLLLAIHWGGVVSWHNNHHAHPAYFTVKRRRWEVDVHYILLRMWEKLGLVWGIRVLDEVPTNSPATLPSLSPNQP